MKNFKIFLLAAVAVVAGAFVSCDDYEFTPGPVAEGPQVYFPEWTTTEYSISDDVDEIAVPVRRVDTGSAVTVALLSDDPSGLFSIPSSVSFAAGEEAASLRISFDRSALEDGSEYPLQIMINDENATTSYGFRTIALSITPWPWELVGTGKYREDYISGLFGCANIEIEVPIHKHKSRPGIYMVEEMFGWTYLTELFEATQAELSGQFSYTPTNFIIDCSNPDAVTFEDQWTGITETVNGYGDFLIAMEPEAPGTLVNGIITFPTKCLYAGLAGGWYYANTSGMFRIMMPGAEAVDYTLSAEYGGMRVAADNVTASAVVDFTYGDDVTGIGYVFASGDATAQAEAIAAAVAAGEVENVYEVENFTAGAGSVSIEAELETGVYTVVALPKDKAGAYVAAEVAAVSFYFPGLGASESPECDLWAMMGPVSEYWPEMLDQYPDTSAIFFEIDGSELKTLTTLMADTETINYYVANGVSEEQLVDNYGTDRTTSWMEYINANGYYGSIFINLESGTSYTLIAKATNIYGNSKVVTVTYSTAAADYNGELVIGDYYMSYESTTSSGARLYENIFTVRSIDGSDTEFFVHNFGYADGLDWYATYDAAASQFVLSGVWKGFEDEETCLGDWWLMTETTAFRYLSYDLDWEYEGDAPIVLTVDPATKQLSGLEVDLEYWQGSVEGTSVTPTSALQFSAFDTVIEPYQSASASVAAPAAAAMKAKLKAGSVCADRYMRSEALRTLQVKSSVCEPLPNESLGRDFKLRESLRAAR